MNYLEKIQELKRIEEEKKRKLERIKEDKEKNKEAYLSNLTFMNFERYIISVLPYFIEEGIKRKEKDYLNPGYLEFTIDDEGNLSCLKESYGVVEKEEFFSYIQSIPGYKGAYYSSVDGTGMEYQFMFKLEELATYYYDKLQELEYFNIDYNNSVKR